MKKYDFDREIDRRNTNSLKWDVKESELPMWVADMDFEAAPPIKEAIKKIAEFGVFGYQILPDEWYFSIMNWWKRRHNFDIKKEWLIFSTGVIPAVTSIVKRITEVGDNIVIQTPVFDIFFHSIENTGRHTVENKLLFDGEKYSIDFDDLEKKLSNPICTLFILCNPHNPIGKIWSKEELEKIGSLCKKYSVTVLSDEIHCDICAPQFNYTPFASVNKECADNSITCVSASKAFNFAGLQTAAVIVPGESLRNRVERGLNSDEVAEPNAFAACATIAAFTKGEEWLDEFREYVEKNRRFAYSFIEKEIPCLNAISQNATYLMWIDCKNITGDTDELCEYIRRKTGLYITAGSQYRGDSKTFVRINIACPLSRVKDGLNRLKDGINSYLSAKK